MKNVREHGVQLTEEEKADLKAFLLTLTDNEFLSNPAYGPPMDIGEYLVR
jgi:cytochrome c peroxidase